MPDLAARFKATAATPPLTPKWLRAIRWVRLITHIAAGLLIAGLLFPRLGVGPKRGFVRWWSRKTLRILNLEVIVHGLPLPESAVGKMVAANHVSWLDIYVLNTIYPARFVAKAEVRGWPIVGLLCERAGTIFIQRTRRGDAARANRLMHEALGEGETIAFFPEGTTTEGDRLLKFHTSLFEPAVKSGADVLPVALRYRAANGAPSREAAYVGDQSFADSLRTIIHQQRISVEVMLAEPVASAGCNRRELAAVLEQKIANMLGVKVATARQHFEVGSGDQSHPAGATDSA